MLSIPAAFPSGKSDSIWSNSVNEYSGQTFDSNWSSSYMGPSLARICSNRQLKVRRSLSQFLHLNLVSFVGMFSSAEICLLCKHAPSLNFRVFQKVFRAHCWIKENITWSLLQAACVCGALPLPTKYILIFWKSSSSWWPSSKAGQRAKNATLWRLQSHCVQQQLWSFTVVLRMWSRYPEFM